MPIRPKKQCNHPGCPNLSNKAKCPEHERKATQKYDQLRGTAVERGYDYQWHKLREFKANNDPLCEECLRKNRVVVLDVVHHILPVKDYPEYRLIYANLMSLCNPCHDDPELIQRLFDRNKVRILNDEIANG